MKTPVKHILVPIDFSGFSDHAISFANGLAGNLNARITLLHIVEPPYNMMTVVEGMTQMIEENARKQLAEKVKLLNDSISKDTVVKHGRTAREIILQANELQADLVVMGTRGQTGVARSVLGSISSVVATNCTKPVAVIPEKEIQLENSSLLFATSLKEKDPENYRFVLELMKPYSASIIPLHITDKLDFQSRIRLRGFRDVLREQAGDSTIEIRVEEESTLLRGMSSALKDVSASMIILNRYGKSTLRKLFSADHTDQILTHARLPLLIIP